MEAEIAVAAGKGFISLWEYGGLITILGLNIIGLVVLCAFLFRRNQEIADRSIEAQMKTAEAIASWTEATRASQATWMEAIRAIQR